MTYPPEVVVIAGPNGAGKSTLARLLLPEAMAFVNADEIAKTLPSAVERAAREMEAGSELLRRVDDLVAGHRSFALETTLSSRSLAPEVARLQTLGYRFPLIFLWLPSADMASERVAARVRRGGHAIPEDTIRRRYEAGLRNFFTLYQPLADDWRVYRNTSIAGPELIASREQVYDDALWKQITQARQP